MRLFRSTIVILAIVLICGCDDEKKDTQLMWAVDTAVKSGNPSACETQLKARESTEPGVVEKCYSQVASRLGKTNVCNLIKDTQKKADCKTNIAKDKKDVFTCNDIEEAKKKANCVSQVGLILVGDAGEAAEEKFNEVYDRIYGEGAHCDKIKNEYDKVKCTANAAYKYDSPELCMKLGDKVGGTNSCLDSVAKSTTNNNICKQISSEVLRDQCTQGVVVELVRQSQDISLCEKMPTQERKNKCYNEVGVKLGFASSCKKLPTEAEQSKCIKELNNQHF